MKENSLIYKLTHLKVVQKALHKLGAFFLRIARYWFFDRVSGACWCCGDMVGMNSVITRGHMWCWKCFERYVLPPLQDAMVAKATDGYHEFLSVDHASKPDQTETIVRTTKKWGEKWG